jgi:hypothetical protein
MFKDPPRRRRWPRAQQFILSERGNAAEASYRSTIVASRAQEGRASFDAARSAWAYSFGIEPDDGLYLGEVRGSRKTLDQIAEAIETCGKTRMHTLAALERLVDSGLVMAA